MAVVAVRGVGRSSRLAWLVQSTSHGALRSGSLIRILMRPGDTYHLLEGGTQVFRGFLCKHSGKGLDRPQVLKETGVAPLC